jgi:thymidylate synthase
MNTTPSWEHQYLGLCQDILECGEDRIDRTGTGTRALFSNQLDIDVSQGFPLLTTKKMPFKMIVSELLWFLEGSTDERRLAEIHHGTRDESVATIWTANAQAAYWKPKAAFDGDLGNVYGKQWRSWEKVTVKSYDDYLNHHDGSGATTYFNAKVVREQFDQIKEAIQKIKSNPTDRRILVSAWNVGDLNNMALPPCHMFFQFFVSLKGGMRRLSLKMYQRSVDTALGLPFNIASYALLLMMVAQVTNCTPHRLIMDLGDTHLYADHLDMIPTQLERKPMASPIVLLNPDVTDIDGFKMDDFALVNYESHPGIPYKMST